ncbi:MAG: hypothetical protein J5776_02350 [Clostridiales bacterium]|nr:hypothetical protein [Clostridiales bacterium]
MADEQKTVAAEEVAVSEAAPKKGGISEAKLEIIIAILLGVTAILMAWAGWISSLHGGNQATNYTQSNNLSAMGNSMYNEAAQYYMQDMLLWNQIYDYAFDAEIANMKGETDEADMIYAKIETLMNDNCTEEFYDAIEWAWDQDWDATPFDKEGYVDSYFAEANAVLDEADALLEQGKTDNANGDAYGLVSVIYSVVLFLLGIVGIFKKIPNRVVITIFAVVLLVIATIFMLTIPLPTGFNIMSYFVH